MGALFKTKTKTKTNKKTKAFKQSKYWSKTDSPVISDCLKPKLWLEGMKVAEAGYQWIPEWAFRPFNIFLNNLEEGMNSVITKVADVAKLFVAGLRVRVRAECGD